MDPLQCGFCRAFNCACDYQDMLARLISTGSTGKVDGNDLVAECAEAIQYLVDMQDAAENMQLQPLPSYQSGPLHERDLMHRMEGRAVVVVPGSVVNEYHFPGERPVDINEAPSHYMEQVGQALEGQSASSPSAAQSVQTSCPSVTCRWRNKDAPRICGVVISCEDVPAHFRDFHKIKGINELVPVDCLWERCFSQVVRKNFARHIRECHLDHIRDKGH